MAKPKESQAKRHIIEYEVNFDCFTLFSYLHKTTEEIRKQSGYDLLGKIKIIINHLKS